MEEGDQLFSIKEPPIKKKKNKNAISEVDNVYIPKTGF